MRTGQRASSQPEGGQLASTSLCQALGSQCRVSRRQLGDSLAAGWLTGVWVPQQLSRMRAVLPSSCGPRAALCQGCGERRAGVCVAASPPQSQDLGFYLPESNMRTVWWHLDALMQSLAASAQP